MSGYASDVPVLMILVLHIAARLPAECHNQTSRAVGVNWAPLQQHRILLLLRLHTSHDDEQDSGRTPPPKHRSVFLNALETISRRSTRRKVKRVLKTSALEGLTIEWPTQVVPIRIVMQKGMFGVWSRRRIEPASHLFVHSITLDV